MQAKHLLLIAILTLTTACSSNKETADENLGESQLCQQAQDDLSNKSYDSAVTRLEALEPCYPLGRYAGQAQFELTYVNYKNMEPEAARATAERFTHLHPQHSNVDYTHYLEGLFSLDQDRGLLVRFLPLDMTKRDPDTACDSFNEFTQLTDCLSNSRYAPDTKVRMAHLRNLSAAYEVHVGHYYLKRQAHVATANHGRYMVENFRGTPTVGDDLAVMVETYRRLGLDDLASISLETLKLNHPDNASLRDGEFTARGSEADTRSWLVKATLGLIRGNESSPYMETQATKDMIKQYEDAEWEIPVELKPESQNRNADDEKPESDDGKNSGRSR